jgi:hypothetical protein
MSYERLDYVRLDATCIEGHEIWSLTLREESGVEDIRGQAKKRVCRPKRK